MTAPPIPLVLDPGVRRAGETLAGGSPRRAIRLSAAGWRAVAELHAGDPGSAAAAALGRRLLDAGVLHPRPPRHEDISAITVVVPVRDRPAQLDRCLTGLGPGIAAIVVDDGSADPAAVAAIAARHQARVVRSEISGGPAQARNRALALARGELIAFLDSDCVPSAGWLEALAGHFADPLVGAVAPRVRPAGAAADGRPLVARYLAARSPLDMGGREAGVTPGGRVSYVPTAALLVRRTALAGGFDPGLRYGEDVDLVWRLGDGGWRVRYDPRVTVEHHEPVTLAAALRRRFRYGTSAGPLARRHPGRMAPAALTPWPAAAAVALTTGHRRLAAAIAGGQGAALARRLAPLRVPPGWIARWIAEAAYGAALSLSRYASMFAAAPVAAWAWRARRPGLAAALLLPGLDAWWRRRPAVDPVRFAALALADDAAYGVGVVWGAMRAGTVAPLLPRMRSVSGG